MFLYSPGGYGESKGRFNDVYEFNTLARCWRLVPNLGDVPKVSTLLARAMWQSGTAPLCLTLTSSPPLLLLALR